MVGKLKLTIGMAAFNNADEVWFTVMSLRLHQMECQRECEIVVVDQSSDAKEAKRIETFVGSLETPRVRYRRYPEPAGTSPSRDEIFRQAQAPAVLVVDSHVELDVLAVSRLIRWYDEHPKTRDLYHGPLFFDSMKSSYTHFDDVWRSNMWGTWGGAWRCPCKDAEGEGVGTRFSMIQDKSPESSIATPCRLLMKRPAVLRCDGCGRDIPALSPWEGHELKLEERGFVRIGMSVDEPPFEIPGMGLGLFSCRTDAWPGFHPDARQFGGEEMCVHELFRKRGDLVWCLPFLAWVHKFRDPEAPAPYPHTLHALVRNYVLWFDRLGYDLAPVEQHFVLDNAPGQHKLERSDWGRLVKDPKGYKIDKGCSSCGNPAPAPANEPAYASVDDAFEKVKSIPRDLNEHMDALRDLASRCPRVTEISKRRESTVAFLAGKPKSLASYNREKIGGPILKYAEEGGIDVHYHGTPDAAYEEGEIRETDLLFIDDQHTFDRTLRDLNDFCPYVTRYVVIHDAVLHGELNPKTGGGKGEDGRDLGIMTAVRVYLIQNQEWSVVKFYRHQYGLVVLSRDPRDKKELPGIVRKAINWTKAHAEYVASGMEDVSQEQFQERLETCATCDQRNDGECGACGCPLEKKARMKVNVCPLGYWPLIGLTKEEIAKAKPQ